MSLRRSDFKGVIRIDIKIPGALPIRCESPAVGLLDESGNYIPDDEAIVQIYDLVIPRVAEGLTDIGHSQQDEIIQLLEDKKDAQRHVRGLVYYIRSLNGTDTNMIHIHRNHAERIVNKTVSDEFVFDFDVAIACSCDVTIKFQGVSSLVDGVVHTYGGDLTARNPDDGEHSVSIGVLSQNVLRRITSDEKNHQPVVPNEINFDRNRSAHDSNASSQNSPSNRVNYSTPSITNQHRGNSKGCRNLNQLPSNNFHGTQSGNNSGNKRFSLMNGNIPASKLGLHASHYVGNLCCKKGETVAERENCLQHIGSTSIPQSRHRNSGKLKDTNAITKKHFLNFYEEFVGRESEHGLYVPPLDAFLPNSDMGREWEESLLPDSLFDKYSAMNQALKEDLLYLCAENKEVLTIVKNCPGGYNALHCLLTIMVPMLMDKIADNSLLVYAPDTSIAYHVRSIKEFILQSSLAGASYTRFQVWKMVIKFLPNEIKLFLTNAGTNLIYRTPGANEVDNVPYSLRIENCTAFIMRELAGAGILFPKRKKATMSDPLDSPQIMAFQRSEKKCYLCHQPGHIASSCPNRKKILNSTRSGRSDSRNQQDQGRQNRSFQSKMNKPAVNAVEHSDDVEPDVDTDDAPTSIDNLTDDIKLGEDVEEDVDVDHPLMVGAVVLDEDPVPSDDVVSETEYQFGDEYGGIYAIRVGEDDHNVLKRNDIASASPVPVETNGWNVSGEDVPSPPSDLFCGKCRISNHTPSVCDRAALPSDSICDFCEDYHMRSDCPFLQKALKTKRSYVKKLRKAKNDADEMLIDKKPAAIVPCPMESLQNFALSMKSNPALAMCQLRKDVREMKLPRTVANRIVEDTIATFERIGHAHGDFSSVRAEENARRALAESVADFRRLMSKMRINVDDVDDM